MSSCPMVVWCLLFFCLAGRLLRFSFDDDDDDFKNKKKRHDEDDDDDDEDDVKEGEDQEEAAAVTTTTAKSAAVLYIRKRISFLEWFYFQRERIIYTCFLCVTKWPLLCIYLQV